MALQTHIGVLQERPAGAHFRTCGVVCPLTWVSRPAPTMAFVTWGINEQSGGPPGQAKSLGGASSAVAASTHAACARFRGTDPLITGMPRRKLAKNLGHPDVSAGIPEARWMRAMTFERLVRDESFASRTATTTVGALGLARPPEVVLADAGVRTDRTAQPPVANRPPLMTVKLGNPTADPRRLTQRERSPRSSRRTWWRSAGDRNVRWATGPRCSSE